MNDIELERTARHAASWTRAEAEVIADPHAALATLLADAELTSSGGESRTRGTGGRWWLWLASAAAVVALVAGIVVVDGQRSNTPAVEPTATVPTPTDPGPTEPPSTSPGSIPPADTASDPAATDAIVVVDDVGTPLEREELATYDIGDGPGELGVEQCEECEPARPWAPVVLADGTIIVADSVNQRWQVARDGEWTATPYRDGETVTGSPVVGPDGLIYALVDDNSRLPRRVVPYDPADLSPVETYETVPGGYESVELRNGAIEVGSVRIVDLGAPLGQPTWQVDGDANTITLALSGISRTFELPSTWSAADDVAALGDGSIVARVETEPADGGNTAVLLRMWPDGTYATGTLAAPAATTNGDGTFTVDRFIQFEDGAIAAYTLPSSAADDLATTSGPIATEDLAAVLGDRAFEQTALAGPPDILRSWVDADGNPSAPASTVTVDPAAVTVQIQDRSWTFDDPVDGAAAWSDIVPTFDGGFLAVVHHGADGRTAVTRGWADGTSHSWALPPELTTWTDATPTPAGLVLVATHGGRYVAVEPFAPRDADTWTGSRDLDPEAGTIEYPGLAEHLEATDPTWETDAVAFANALAGQLTSPAEQRSVRLLEMSSAGPVVEVRTEGLLDDSSYGTRLVVHLATTDGGLRLDRVEWSQACQPGRGHQDYQPGLCT